jgi:hypothetical protein
MLIDPSGTADASCLSLNTPQDVPLVTVLDVAPMKRKRLRMLKYLDFAPGVRHNQAHRLSTNI